jgi:hypothetical protein
MIWTSFVGLPGSRDLLPGKPAGGYHQRGMADLIEELQKIDVVRIIEEVA